jgi:NAD-dependent dihydropyrimidine dehydrogenase PreA subunit
VGIFIQITLDTSRLGPDEVQRLASVCPVDIFGLEGGQLVVRPDEEDECTLCELCLKAAPAGAVTIRKLYKDEELTSTGVKTAS